MTEFVTRSAGSARLKRVESTAEYSTETTTGFDWRINALGRSVELQPLGETMLDVDLVRPMASAPGEDRLRHRPLDDRELVARVNLELLGRRCVAIELEDDLVLAGRQLERL